MMMGPDREGAVRMEAASTGRFHLGLAALVAGFALALAGTQTGFLFARTFSGRQDAGKTVWDGVYSLDQAGRGREAYETSCSSCHQLALTGAGEAPALAGDAFMQRWREDHLSSLFTRISTLMPFDNPSTLSNDAYLDIVAYILQINGFPAGTSALEPDDLVNIRVIAKEGPGPVPDFALVRAMGCLTSGPDRTWLLTNGTEPARTSTPAPSSEAELKAAAAKPLGTQTYRLLGVYPSPDPHAGHKVEAKGFLVRMGDETRINVSSLQMIDSSCER
jgi:mono/diheme cytochrome c family protein